MADLPPGAPRIEGGPTDAPGLSTDAPPVVKELQKQAARVNTNLRFGKRGEALAEGYRLRLELEACGIDHPAIDEELKLVDELIERLERRRFGYHRYLARLFMKALFDALTGKSSSAG